MIGGENFLQLTERPFMGYIHRWIAAYNILNINLIPMRGKSHSQCKERVNDKAFTVQ